MTQTPALPGGDPAGTIQRKSVSPQGFRVPELHDLGIHTPCLPGGPFEATTQR